MEEKVESELAEELEQEIDVKNFWYSEWAFPLFVGILAAGVFAGTHLYYVYHVGIFSDIAIAAMLSEGMKTGNYGAAAAFGASFLFARVLEGPLVGILDIGGSIYTGIGIGLAATLLAAGITAPLTNFPLALLTGGIAGVLIGTIIILIRRLVSNTSNTSFGTDVMMGAGNSAGRLLGPLIVISAAMTTIPVGLGSIIGATLFYIWKKPITGGAILGAMILGAFFPIPK